MELWWVAAGTVVIRSKRGGTATANSMHSFSFFSPFPYFRFLALTVIVITSRYAGAIAAAKPSEEAYIRSWNMAVGLIMHAQNYN